MPTVVTEENALSERKGQRVKLRDATLRKYRGYTGAWLDLAKAPMKTKHHIIIEKPKQGGGVCLISRTADKWNVEGDTDEAPKTYTQAAFKQVPQLPEKRDESQWRLRKPRCRCRTKW